VLTQLGSGYTVSGKIVGSSGGAISGATVRLKQGASIQDTTTSASTGRWTFSNLTAGIYTIQAARQYYNTNTSAPFTLSSNLGGIDVTLLAEGEAGDPIDPPAIVIDLPPDLLSATLEAATTLKLKFSEAVSNVSASGWSVEINGDTSIAVNSVSGSGTEWTLTLSSAINYWDEVTLSYSGSAVTDSGGNKLEPIGGMGVLNSLEDSRGAGLYLDSDRANKLGSATAIAEAVAYINGNGTENAAYTLIIDANQDCNPLTLSAATLKSGVTLRLKGKGSERVIQLWGSGALFTVGSGITLVLDNHITLKGHGSNYYSLVSIESGGTLKMRAGSGVTGNSNSGVSVSGGTFEMSGGTISGNTASSAGGGGVNFSGSSTFEMSGGTISGNTASAYYSGGSVHYPSGGVYFSGSGIFNMSGGTISGNTASAYNSGGSVDYSGGGVYFSGSGTFKMSGGTISGNTASSASPSSRASSTYSGGGVNFSGTGTFEMSGGAISSNTASSTASTEASHAYSGSGVCVSVGTFEMSGGSISGNTASAMASYYSAGGSSSAYSAGGVYYSGSGTFKMRGGSISSNTASSTAPADGIFTSNYPTYTYSGGGVYFSNATFEMSGGTISGNTASSASPSSHASSTYSGGGVYVSGSIFAMSGGTIGGNTGTSTGGGVFIGNGTFIKDTTGGIIYGKNEGNNSNTSGKGDTFGHAVSYAYGNYYRDTTVGASDRLSTSMLPLSGTEFGWTKK
jgi:hypothetical protein